MDLRTHDVAALRRVLWAAVYSEQHVPARRDRRHRRDMRHRGFDQAERARFRAAARRHAPPPRLDREEHASAILHTPRRAQRCPVERSFYLVRRAFDCGLPHHASGPYRVFERVDGGVVCAAEAGAEAVLCGGEGRIDFDTFPSLNGTGESLDKVASTAFASVLPLAPKRQ